MKSKLIKTTIPFKDDRWWTRASWQQWCAKHNNWKTECKGRVHLNT